MLFGTPEYPSALLFIVGKTVSKFPLSEWLMWRHVNLSPSVAVSSSS